MTQRLVSASPPGQHIFVVRPHKESREVAAHVETCRARVEASSVRLTTFRTERARLVGEAPERAVDLLGTDEAAGLYRALHRERVLVIAFSAVHVRRDPRRDPPARRAAMTLQTFVQHKAYFGMVRGAGETSALFQRYAGWCQEVQCEGELDPRALPLHVFETRRDWTDLGTPAGDRRFGALYGRPGTRRDEGGKNWSRAHHHHGGPALVVAGCALPAGMHWDVGSDGGVTTVQNSREIWRLRGRGAYVAVYPDAGIRSGRGRGTAKRVWPLVDRQGRSRK